MRKLPLGVFLILGFALGQGSVFAVNASLLFSTNAALAGIFVLSIANFSLALQFSDLGNVTHFQSLLKNGDPVGQADFLGARSAVGFLVSALAAFLLFNASNSLGLTLYVSLCSGVSAYLYGGARVGLLETKGNYYAFGLIQAYPWLLFSALSWMALVLFSNSMSVIVVAGLQPVIAVFYRIYLLRVLNDDQPQTWIAVTTTAKAIYSFAAAAANAIIGQVWGRIIVAYIAAETSATMLGSFGLIRQIEIASILVLTFLMRPTMARIASQQTPDHLGISRDRSIQLLLLLALLLSILYGSAPLLLTHSSESVANLLYWLPVLLGTFFGLLSSTFHQSILMQGTSGAVLVFDQINLTSSVLIFIFLCKYSVPIAILFSEINAAVMNYFGSKYIPRKS